MSAPGSEGLVARASRVLVSASRRNDLLGRNLDSKGGAREVRDSEDAITSTRDECPTPDGV
jgi:hypothetical protein